LMRRKIFTMPGMKLQLQKYYTHNSNPKTFDLPVRIFLMDSNYGVSDRRNYLAISGKYRMETAEKGMSSSRSK